MNTRRLERLERTVGQFERRLNLDPNAPRSIRRADGALDYNDRNGIWEYRQKLYGDRAFGGTVVVSENGVAVWMVSVFGGWARGVDLNEAGDALDKALEPGIDRVPFRGPKHFEVDDFIYVHAWEGDMRRFAGYEELFKGGKEQYYARYAGGLI